MNFSLPGGPPSLEQAVERSRRGVPSFPLRFWRVATADLPSAIDEKSIGAIVWDTDELVIKWSDGTSWVKPALSDHTHTSASVTDFNEAAQDAVGGALADSSTIDFTYDDAAGSITAIVKDDSITYSKIQNVSATQRLLGRSSSGAGDVEEIPVGAWTAYTPTVSSFSGTITTASASGRYLKIGRAVFLQISVTITTNGTGAGLLQVSLPFAVSGGAVIPGREVSATGKAVTATALGGGSTLFLVNYDNTYPAGDGHVFQIGGTYEATA